MVSFVMLFRLLGVIFLALIPLVAIMSRPKAGGPAPRRTDAGACIRSARQLTLNAGAQLRQRSIQARRHAPPRRLLERIGERNQPWFAAGVPRERHAEGNRRTAAWTARAVNGTMIDG